MKELSNNGFELIKKFEGLVLNAYRDSAGIWTIGYGSTRYHDGKAVKPGDKLTSNDQAEALFKNTIKQYVASVNSSVKVSINQNQFDALVSFAYNAGVGALVKSTLLKKLNSGDYAGAADQFLVWNKITDPKTGEKVILDGLVKRRAAERKLFLSA